jgi:hypothetical protein
MTRPCGCGRLVTWSQNNTDQAAAITKEELLALLE